MRKGTILVEAIVLVFIILILIALIAPAIKSVRDATKRQQQRQSVESKSEISTDDETLLKEDYGLPKNCKLLSNLGNGWVIFEIEVPRTDVLGETTAEEGHKKTILYHHSNGNYIELSKDSVSVPEAENKQ